MRRLLAIATLVVFTLSIASATIQAQPQSKYDLSWATFSSGGVMFSQSIKYYLSGTLDEVAAGPSTGLKYALDSGFWGGVRGFFYVVLPEIEKGNKHSTPPGNEPTESLAGSRSSENR